MSKKICMRTPAVDQIKDSPLACLHAKPKGQKFCARGTGEVTAQGKRSQKKYTARHREEVTGQERVFMQKKGALRALQGKRQDAAEPCRKRRKTKKMARRAPGK
jgi:hypothetical protein